MSISAPKPLGANEVNQLTNNLVAGTGLISSWGCFPRFLSGQMDGLDPDPVRFQAGVRAGASVISADPNFEPQLVAVSLFFLGVMAQRTSRCSMDMVFLNIARMRLL